VPLRRRGSLSVNAKTTPERGEKTPFHGREPRQGGWGDQRENLKTLKAGDVLKLLGGERERDLIAPSTKSPRQGAPRSKRMGNKKSTSEIRKKKESRRHRHKKYCKKARNQSEGQAFLTKESREDVSDDAIAKLKGKICPAVDAL